MSSNKSILSGLIFLAICLSAKGINPDSLKAVVSEAADDTIKVNQLIMLSGEIYRTAPEEAVQFGMEAIDLGDRLGFSRGIGYAWKNVGLGYYFQGDYPEAIDAWQQALSIFESENDKRGMSNMMNNLGAVYNNFGDDAQALELYLRSLEVSEEINDTLRTLTALINIGLIYQKKTQTHDKALDYYLKALPLSEVIGDQDAIGTAAVNLGTIYYNMGEYDEALSYYEKSLDAYEQSGSGYVSFALTNIGKVYARRGDFQRAIDFQNHAYEIAEERDAKLYMVQTLLGLAETYKDQGNTLTSLGYYRRAKDIAENIGAIYELEIAYDGMATSFSELSNYTEAYKSLVELIRVKDTIFSEKNQEQLNALQIQYETEVLERENQILKRDIDLSEAKEKQQKLIIYLFILGFVFAIFFIGMLYRSNRIKRKTNAELEEKNILITEQKNEITDSIQYARRIQHAMLPPGDYISSVLPERFILFRPRDIVSGDFYWITEKEGKIICAVADCTGHGVPGAFMSMLGIAFLNEIVSKQTTVHAGNILNDLRSKLMKSLRQTDHSSQVLDGIDLALIILDLPHNYLEYAGAMNPLFMFRGGELIEHQADKMPIGYHINMAQPFTNHKIPIKEGDVLYAFSDGFVDQFGGPKGKKIMMSNFKRMLEQIHDQSMEEQKLFLEKYLDDWMTEYNQIDDILVVGIRI
jgi:tetratricopeptide (TPR) repeat protein/serine phosphatase RsbU (regulator of sigma subunit)